MKKLFLLISVLTLSIAVNAKQWEIGPTSPQSSDNIRRTVRDNVATGDTIVLADGTYTEADVIAFNKSITLMPAENAHPIISHHYYSTISGGARVKFIGIKFDGSIYPSSDHCFYPNDDSNGNVLLFEDCEFKSYASRVFCISSGKKLDSCLMYNCSFATAKSILYNESAGVKYFKMDGCEVSGISEQAIYTSSASHMDTCVINDCYFHNNAKTAIYIEKNASTTETCDGVLVTNSTFANSTAAVASVICVFNYNYDKASKIKVYVDHCTFYNNEPTNTDHAQIRVYRSTNVKISNCIFAHPTAIAQKATSCYGGTISNCLVHNFTYTSSGHRTDDITPKENIVADPLFNDLANNRYTFAGNWSTGPISPAREAATDRSDIGDPRWYTSATVPSISFASAYNLLSTNALLAGNIRLNANDHIEYYDNSVCGTATWKVHAERTCAVQAVVDMETSSASGSIFKLMAYDNDGNKLDSATCTYKNDDADIVLSGALYFPTVGDYKLKLFNEQSHSSAKVEKITLSYYGGAVQNISPSANTTLNVADALFTNGFTRADGQVSPGSWKPSEKPLGYVKWNIATSATKFYDLTLNFSSTNAHSMAVNIYEDEEAEPVATVSESYTSTTGTLTLTDRINLVGGKNYIVKVTNPTSGSEAKVTSVVFAPVAASATELPNTLAFADAVLSAKAHITGGMLYFNEIGDTDPRGQWAQWSVTTDHDGLFLFTMGATSTNGQNYKITIKDDGDNVLDYYETSLNSGDKTITHYFALETGSYFVKVENTRSYSKGHLTSLVVTEPGDVMTIDEAATDNTSWSDKVVDEEATSPTYNVQIIRTLKANMYNTFCLPFRVPDNMCKDLFGSDVEIYTLKEAIVDDNILNLELNKSSDVWQGTPVFIKPSRNIVNPVFSGVVFKRLVPSATTKTNANFTGSFVATTLGPDPDILFLAQDNMLYYPQEEIPILGLRGWLVLHDSPAPISPRRANFILPDKMPTAIEIVNGDILPLDKTMKVIENDQLIIIRDGVRYNVMGVRVK